MLQCLQHGFHLFAAKLQCLCALYESYHNPQEAAVLGSVCLIGA